MLQLGCKNICGGSMSTTLKGTLITLIAGIVWDYPELAGIFNGSWIFSYWVNKSSFAVFWYCPHYSFLRCR